MKATKNKGKRMFSSIEQITSVYFPSEVKKRRNAVKENPRTLGKHFATQALRQVKLS
jgi:hypothetical protein